MNKGSIIACLIGIAGLLALSVFVTQHVVVEWYERGISSEGTVLGYTFFNQSCSSCEYACISVLCDGVCNVYGYSGGLIVKYNNSNGTMCESNVRLRNVCGNTVAQAVAAAKDTYTLNAQINGYSPSNKCGFTTKYNNLFAMWIITAVCWGLILVAVFVFVFNLTGRFRCCIDSCSGRDRDGIGGGCSGWCCKRNSQTHHNLFSTHQRYY